MLISLFCIGGILNDGKKEYQSLHEDRIFIGSAGDVTRLIEEEQCDVIVDLRAEVEEISLPEYVERIHIPLIDQQESQEEQILSAANEVVRHYREGKKVALHCAAGRSRTGSVAIVTLLSLGLFSDIEDNYFLVFYTNFSLQQ
ncbi:hypothetical protein BC351_02765 [Paenibacillus ferrarius]|uniref:Tyrosine specific protein phosphatases domain-containing protein n=1 Tax=Paenibacillus ferrarius TaxID=1469647 RepID=A0A1V4HTB1_9BACL|nr:dual specificity protein phosphatase family protein [Paenibacillus ferrarius]OPH62169.1 hypothetical protein BC351_02765 [Paenibacillus ferrarius]